VLLVQHNDEGALGLVLNRPLQTTVQEMWQQVDEGTQCGVGGALHQGGPCEGALMVVHAAEDRAESEVAKGIYFCMRRDVIERLVAENQAAMKILRRLRRLDRRAIGRRNERRKLADHPRHAGDWFLRGMNISGRI